MIKLTLHTADIQIQESQKFPKKTDPKRCTPKHIIDKISKVKDKEKILKAARKKHLVMWQGNPHDIISKFFNKNCRLEGNGQYIQSAKGKHKRTKPSNQEYST